jgi:hypothetical protein
MRTSRRVARALGWNVWNDPRENVVEGAGRTLCYGMTEVYGVDLNVGGRMIERSDGVRGGCGDKRVAASRDAV